jgi:capsular polysaccharide biosynthesis protein
MFSLNKKFRATNNPRHLDKSLEKYFELRTNWGLDAERFATATIVISGWASTETLRALKKLVFRSKARRVFRPDVWYQTRGRAGFFSGFSFRVSNSDVAEVMNLLKDKFPSLLSTTLMENSQDLMVGYFGRLESVNPDQRELGLNWFSTYSVSPRDFAWLVEITADRQIATVASNFFSSIEGFELSDEALFCKSKFQLMLCGAETRQRVGDWYLHDIKEPEWLELDKTVGDEIAEMRRGVRPKYFQANDVSILNGGIILQGSSFLNWDYAQHPALDFVAGNHNYIIGSSANMNYCLIREATEGKEFEQGIIISSRVDSNWFHFLIETLPRILLVENIVPKDIPVIVSSRVPESGLEALRLVTSRQIIRVDESRATRVQRAYVPGPVIYHPDTQFLWGSDLSGCVNIAALKELRSIVLNSFDTSAIYARSYLERSGRNRVILNKWAVRLVLNKFGFKTYDPGKMSFEAQINLIVGSDLMVVPGGAVMSNFIFCKPGARIIVLVSKFGEVYSMPKLLGSVAGAEVRILGGRRDFFTLLDSIVSKSHASFRVRIWKLLKLIDTSI